MGAISTTMMKESYVCLNEGHSTYYSAIGCDCALLWRHNGLDGVSNHQPHHCLLGRLFGRRSKITSNSASLAFVRGIHRGPVNSPHKWPVTRKMPPFDDVIMGSHQPEKKQHPTKVPPSHVREMKRPSDIAILVSGEIAAKLLNRINQDYQSIKLKYAAGYHCIIANNDFKKDMISKQKVAN